MVPTHPRISYLLLSLALKIAFSLRCVLSLSIACSKNYHHKCKDKVPNLCGVNQKLLADALYLAEVRH